MPGTTASAGGAVSCGRRVAAGSGRRSSPKASSRTESGPFASPPRLRLRGDNRGRGGWAEGRVGRDDLPGPSRPPAPSDARGRRPTRIAGAARASCAPRAPPATARPGRSGPVEAVPGAAQRLAVQRGLRPSVGSGPDSRKAGQPTVQRLLAGDPSDPRRQFPQTAGRRRSPTEPRRPASLVNSHGGRDVEIIPWNSGCWRRFFREIVPRGCLGEKALSH